MVNTNFVHALTKDNVVNALGYVPASERGINLIPNTGTPTILEASTSNFNFKNFGLTVEKLTKGEKYTVSADIEILVGTFNKVTAVPYNKAVNASQAERIDTVITNGKIYGVIEITGDSAEVLLIYARPKESTSGNSIKISNLKLEQGVVDNPVWTPAPEDMVMRSELEDKLGFIKYYKYIQSALNDSNLENS